MHCFGQVVMLIVLHVSNLGQNLNFRTVEMNQINITLHRHHSNAHEAVNPYESLQPKMGKNASFQKIPKLPC